MTQVAVVQQAIDVLGPGVLSEPTLRAIETGRASPTERILGAVSQGLRWPPDALVRIRDGADPDEITAEAQAAEDDDPTDPGGAPGEVAELREVVEAQGAELAELKQLLIDQNELLRAALSGRADELLADDGRGLSHRPQPEPMTGDEGA